MGLTAHTPTVVLALLAAVAVSGCGISIEFGETTERRTDRRLIPADDATAVTVTTENGSIEVEARPVEEIEVVATIDSRASDEGELVIERHDGRVTIAGECDDHDDCVVALQITIPTGIDVDLATENGSLLVNGPTGTLDAESNNGAIELREVAADDIRVRTSNGRIESVHAVAPRHLDARSSNGAIVIVVPDGVYDVHADSDNGGIGVTVPTEAGAAHRIEARTGNGAIAVSTRSSD